MICQILFSEENINKENIDMSSAELSHRVLSVQIHVL